MSFGFGGCWGEALANEREICSGIPRNWGGACLDKLYSYTDECERRRSENGHGWIFAIISADVEVKEKSNNDKNATLIVYPNKRVNVTDGYKVKSISRRKTDEISKLFLGKDLLLPDLKVIMSTENGDQKVCKVTSLKSVNDNGRKGLQLNVSTSEYEGVDTTAKRALSLSDMSNKEDNATVTLISSTPSFNQLLKSNLDNFRTLSTAIEAADLENDPRVQGLFDGTKEYTVFVPTDDAFSKLPDETVTDLLKPKNRSKLRKILRNHIVPLSAADIMKKKSIKTVDGKRLKIKVKDGKVYVGNARVITDVTVSNGYAHVINRVLLPE